MYNLKQLHYSKSITDFTDSPHLPPSIRKPLFTYDSTVFDTIHSSTECIEHIEPSVDADNCSVYICMYSKDIQLNSVRCSRLWCRRNSERQLYDTAQQQMSCKC